jgi:hypothetical protein
MLLAIAMDSRRRLAPQAHGGELDLYTYLASYP